MGKVSWTERVRIEEVLLRSKTEKNVVQIIKRRKASYNGHVLDRNRLTKYVIKGVIEGKSEVTGK
jgi:hypothetical protein